MKLKLIIFIIFITSSINICSANNNVAVGATVDLTSDNLTCRKFTNNCTQNVNIPFKTDSEVSSTIGNLPACITITNC